METEQTQAMSPQNKVILRKTAGWINFFVITLYIFSGCVLLAALFIMNQNNYPPYVAETLGGIGFILLGIMIFYAVQLTRYIKSIREAIIEENINLLTRGLGGYKNFFTASAILSALIFVIILIGFMVTQTMNL